MSINLDWYQKDKYYIQSKCGYRVCKSIIGDEVKYTAWTDCRPIREIIRVFMDVDGAKAACELYSIEKGNFITITDR